MNRRECDILRFLIETSYTSQREIAEISGYSLGGVNRSLKELVEKGYIDVTYRPTKKTFEELKCKSPKNAIILAAGFGMRMVPINLETSKGLLEVKGEVLIERLIRQLHEVDIYEIYVVVGFMKEQYEYLIDKYGVKLLANSEYVTKNNLHSLKRALDYLSNTYVVPCDIWCKENPFRKHELYSWYMVNNLTDGNSSVRINRKMELAIVPKGTAGNGMIGIAYLTEDEAAIVKNRISILSKQTEYDDSFWEEAIYQKDKMLLQARLVDSTEFVEIDTYEQLRELDSNSNQLNSDAIMVIAKVMKVDTNDITNIKVLKKGMTNRSFMFACKGEMYIMRIPGEGTSQLIDRCHEASVYEVISGKGLCEDPIYLNPENGYKIMRYIKNVRCCDPFDESDLNKCMKKLRDFHNMELKVDHEFDIWKMIDFYEELWNGQPSIYKDYADTKTHVLSLKSFIDKHVEKKILTHIDAVPDNFLFDASIEEETDELFLQLTDWEYAGMQDPHVDIAMFCIYSLYDKPQIDQLISIYFEGNCTKPIRLKIYSYIAACGLLWSNWCEYKRSLGVEFGEYSLRQYRYAKEFYGLVIKEQKEEN